MERKLVKSSTMYNW